MVVQWQSGRAVAVKWHRIRTRVALRLFIGSDVNWVAFQCLSSSAVAVKWHWFKTGLIGCNSYYFTANEWPLNQSNINSVPLIFHCAANGTTDSKSDFLLPLNNQLTIPTPSQFHSTINVMPIKPHNATQNSLLPMKDHSNNPIHFQCHWTVIVLPIGWQNPQSEYFISTE